MKDRLAEIDNVLSEMGRLSGSESVRSDESPSLRDSARRWIRRTLIVLVAALLPFLLLVKGSAWLYLDFGVPAYVALLGSVGGVFVLLMLYTGFIMLRLTGRFRLSGLTVRALAVLVVVVCGYLLLFISAGNVKSTQVQSTYTSLHPVLRLAVSTLVLADGDAVITDTQRTPEDYERMGLPLNERSLHFRQPTGYVHALDLRTKGRGEMRNSLVRLYFRLMGFRTIRHVGTADHLHVSLEVR
ncbi:MAG: hypothetical protein KJO98_03145 [Rhodothermia bacterium]|nr:hypothetical protein [Rhodothermia bacterium]